MIIALIQWFFVWSEDVQTDSVKQQIPENPQIKEEPEEQRLKQEEEQLPEFTAECVKSEEQQQTDNSSDTDNDEDWEPPASSSTAQMETEADGDDYNQVQRKDTSTALFSTYKCGTGSHLSGTETAAGSHLSGTETAAGSHLSGPETAAGSHLSGPETAAGSHLSGTETAAGSHLSGTETAAGDGTLGGVYTGSQTAVVSLVSSEQKLKTVSKMCAKLAAVRALMQERLTAAAEEIFALVERTIAEFEEELCRSKEENQRKQQLLDSLLKPQLHTAAQDVQTDRFSPEPSVKQQIPDTPQIKEEPEEQRLKQEEEQLPEFTAECVKSEEQQQTDNSSDTDNDDDWEPPASSSTAQMETEADGDDYNQGLKHQQGRTCQGLKQQHGRTCQGLKQQQGRTCQGPKQQQEK
ncbi:hypothetical protein WMY93_011850 [Mugilogobius chulae]|uniref:Uncharacterized protein n=1 Tax=Mugilogobius chulae TaxID=88201 RepID=A0AAW0PCM3_9GOBI